jgi:hypothetical protein
VGSAGDYSIEALRAGDVVETSATAATFALPNVVRWELAPESRVVVQSAASPSGLGHVLALERGSVHAEVTPRPASEGLVEAFAIEVGQTRVAVHGTAFRVTRTADGVLVEVEHGAVAVGPAGYGGSTTAHLLVAPARATFSLDGGRTAAMLPPAPPVVSDPVTPASPTAQVAESGRHIDAPATPGAASSHAGGSDMRVIETPAAVAPSVVQTAAAGAASETPAAAATTTLPMTPAPVAPQHLTQSAIRATLAHCFQQAYDPSSSSLKVSVSSTFRLHLRPDGSIQSARFDPPLKPEFQQCAGAILAGRFAEGSGDEVNIPVSFGP